jgi:hypothetical protein
MSKSLLYRFLGLGKMPWEVRSKLQLEGLNLFDEGIKASVTYLNFHRPGRYANWRRQWFSACIALTNERLFALRYGKPIINVPLADERLQKMQFSLEGLETLLVRFDAGLFHDDWSGTIEYRLRTDQAAAFLEALSRANSK